MDSGGCCSSQVGSNEQPTLVTALPCRNGRPGAGRGIQCIANHWDVMGSHTHLFEVCFCFVSFSTVYDSCHTWCMSLHCIFTARN